WDAREERIATLVSSNEGPQLHDPDTAGAANEMIELMSEAAGAGANPTQVVAPRIALEENGKTACSYAGWVGDLGIKANVATRDASQRASKSSPWRSLQLAQDASWSEADGGSELGDETRGKLLSTGQLDLAGQ